MDKNQLNKIKNIVEAKNMKKMMFTMEGNLCAARIREGRYRHNPPLTQEDLARMMKTESGNMRQPVFKGLRDDKLPEECIVKEK